MMQIWPFLWAQICIKSPWERKCVERSITVHQMYSESNVTSCLKHVINNDKLAIAGKQRLRIGHAVTKQEVTLLSEYIWQGYMAIRSILSLFSYLCLYV